MFGRSGNGPAGRLPLRSTPKTYVASTFGLMAPLIHAEETEVPIPQERTRRLHGVELGELRPDVVLVELEASSRPCRRARSPARRRTSATWPARAWPRPALSRARRSRPSTASEGERRRAGRTGRRVSRKLRSKAIIGASSFRSNRFSRSRRHGPARAAGDRSYGPGPLPPGAGRPIAPFDGARRRAGSSTPHQVTPHSLSTPRRSARKIRVAPGERAFSKPLRVCSRSPRQGARRT